MNKFVGTEVEPGQETPTWSTSQGEKPCSVSVTRIESEAPSAVADEWKDQLGVR